MRSLTYTVLLAAACASPARDDAAGTTAGSGETEAGTTISASTTGDGSSTAADTNGASTTTGVGDGSTSDTTSSGAESTGGDPVQDAIDRGIAGAATLADADIVMLLLLDVIHRRFEVDAFAGAAAQYDAALAARPQAPIDAFAFRRVFDPGQLLTAKELAQVGKGVNEVTIPAMFCDTLPLAPDYGDRLAADAALGGYELTHVALALRWIDELQCTPVDADFVAQVVADTVALIDPDDGLDDLEIEAAMFGALLAGTDALPDLSDALLQGQLTDGTWPHDPGDREGDWHTTGLALMLLLQLHRPPADGFLAGTSA